MSTKEEIFNYVMNSPENTNPAVLKSMLDGIEGGGGSGDVRLIPYELINNTEASIERDELFIIATNYNGIPIITTNNTGYVLFHNAGVSFGFMAISLNSEEGNIYTVMINDTELIPVDKGKGRYVWKKIYTPNTIPDSITVVVDFKPASAQEP